MTLSTARISFHLSWSIGTNTSENEGNGGHCPWCFVTAGFTMLAAISIFFVTFFHILVHPSGNDSSRMGSVMCQAFNFNSMLIRMVPDLDFQYWANFSCVLESILVGTESSFPGNVHYRHAPAPPAPSTRRHLDKTSGFASYDKSYVLWKRFESFAVTSQQIHLCWNLDRKRFR